jgi:hypothetical protein
MKQKNKVILLALCFIFIISLGFFLINSLTLNSAEISVLEKVNTNKKSLIDHLKKENKDRINQIYYLIQREGITHRHQDLVKRCTKINSLSDSLALFIEDQKNGYSGDSVSIGELKTSIKKALEDYQVRLLVLSRDSTPLSILKDSVNIGFDNKYFKNNNKELIALELNGFSEEVYHHSAIVLSKIHKRLKGRGFN